MRKTVLITGGTKGLGAAITEIFAQNNYDIVMTYNTSEALAQKLADRLKKEYDVSIRVEKLDVTDEDNIKSLVGKMTRLDVLINNASYNNDTYLLDKTKEEFIKIFDTNVVGPFLLIKYSSKLLKESEGNIINIASTNGLDTMYTESADYDASKAALMNMTKNLATFFAPTVRVNAIAPGWIDTEATKDMHPNFRKEETQKIGMHRFATPREIAETVYFVASEKASYMTGSIIRIDGGKA
jgi:NAD(P)-dependent dehydrogenase (short-subunit alcohol dehydrogenase family)